MTSSFDSARLRERKVAPSASRQRALLRPRVALQAAAASLCAVVTLAWGQAAAVPVSLPIPSNVVSFTALATTEVTMDMLTVVFSTTKEGTDANVVQIALKQALDTALTEARKGARPGQLDVQTGHFSLYPRYTGKGVPSGWAGSTSLTVQGRDIAAIAALTGRVPTMSIARVGYELSREAREKVEADVTAQAIARYRAKAAEISRQFGFTGYALREINVSTNEPTSVGMPMRARMSAAASAEESLPTEAGKANVTTTVSGSVQLMK